MLAFLWISLGAIAGANARYALSRWAARALTPAFPFGTLIINVTGSFLLGLFLAWTTERVLVDVRWRLLIAVGFCGGYTTFSTFSYDTMLLLEDGEGLRSGGYVLLSVVLSLAATWLGILAARELLALRSQT